MIRKWVNISVMYYYIECIASSSTVAITHMQINDYARGTTSVDRKQLGYVQRGCGRTVEETEMIPILHSKEKTVEVKLYCYKLQPIAGSTRASSG